LSERRSLEAGLEPATQSGHEAGIAREGQVRSNVVALPVCATCGAAELLLPAALLDRWFSDGRALHSLLRDLDHEKQMAFQQARLQPRRR